MKTSESIGAIAKALVAFQAEVKDPHKGATNPHFNNKYVSLDGLLQAVRPVLTKHGLSVMQMPAGDGTLITCTTTIMHESGEWIQSDPLVLRADKATPQGAGSAVTYARRYQLSAVLGIAGDEDDDGTLAETSKREEPKKPVRSEEWQALYKQMTEVGKGIDPETKKALVQKKGKPIGEFTEIELKELLGELEWIANGTE